VPEPKKVLVVEDDNAVREIVCDVLDDAGFAAKGAINGQDAISVLESGERPALILLDLTMPVMDGWKFRAWQRAHDRFSTIPVILLSAIRDLKKHGNALGVSDVIEKPVELDALLEAVTRLAG
jgi:CheY-like chemotaxis protein